MTKRSNARPATLIDFPSAVPGLRADPVKAEIAKTLRAKREAWEADHAMRMVEDPGAGASVPPAASLGEAVGAAVSIANLHKDAAEMERDRRIEAEERADGNYQEGQKEADGRWGVMLGIVQENNKTILQLVQANHATEVQALQQKQNDILARIEAGQAAAIAAREVEIKRRDDAIVDLHGQVQQLATRRTIEQELLEALRSPDPKNHPAVKMFLGLFGAKAGLTREDIENQLLQDQALEHVEGLRDAREAARAEREAKAIRGEKTAKLIDGLVGIVEAARPAIPHILATAANVSPPVQEPVGWSPEG